ncbi:MAG: pyridoxine 4-dehydrogenase [Frankiales bacterium]|jgi:aryl-alcohol dehydrogenase-like predicted oxidoreductase|nr:pyridoxine 4-dehydrogenase [Frankiales bacterium]
MTIGDAGTTAIGDLTVPRFGYGTMRLTGPGIWGPPADPDEAVRVLRRAYELGVRVIDCAWYYGPEAAHLLLREALAPYPDDLVLVSKLGAWREHDHSWHPAVSPAQLRAGCERDLELLGIESVPVTHLRWTPGDGVTTTFEDALATMVELKAEGKIQRIGLSNVTLEQLDLALAGTEIVTVSNLYSAGQRADDPVVDRCTEQGIAYLPFFPLAMGKIGRESVVSAVAERLETTASVVALAWLLQRSPVMLPIPGTSKVGHLEENLSATDLVLTPADLAELDGTLA